MGTIILSKKRSRNRILAVCLGALILLFQNCSGQFSTIEPNSPAGSSSSAASGGSSNDSGAATGTGGTGTGTGTATTTTTTMAPTSQDQLNRAACRTNQSTPIFNALGTTSIAQSSGLAAGSGDTAQGSLPTFTVIGRKNPINPSIETSSSCANYSTISVRCSIVVDASHPATISRAIALTGANEAASATTDAQKRSLIGRAIDMQECDNDALANGTRTFRIRNNRDAQDNYVRCVQATFTMQLILRSSVDTNNQDSQIQYVQVTLNDGCWGESRLKEAGNAEFPKLAQAGANVAIDGSWAAAVASQQSYGSTQDVGAVHVYRLSGGTWGYSQKLQPHTEAGSNIAAVAIKGNTLVLSSAYKNNGNGSVYIYNYNGSNWGTPQELSAPANQDSQLFGYSLAFDGSNLLVGAPNYSRTGGDRSGVVYHYALSNGSYVYQNTLSWSGGDYADRGFGFSLSLDNGYLAVGAPQATLRESLGRGAVAVYQLSGGNFSLQSTKAPPAGMSANNGLRFGYSVSVKGTRLAIGATGHQPDAGNINAGAAAYYGSVGSANPDKVFVSTEATGKMGMSVALGDSGIYIGAPLRDGRSGYVDYYLYSDLNNMRFRLLNWNRTSNNSFGWSVATSGGYVMVGAYNKDDPQTASGAVYMYGVK